MCESPNTRMSLSYFVVAAVGTAAVITAAPALAGEHPGTTTRHAAAPPVAHLCSPQGTPSTLTFAGVDGWIWRTGWEAGANATPCKQAYAAAVSFARATPPDRTGTPKPLTVFIDGPTGYTFVYLAEDGWKFAGKVADRR